MLFIAPVLGLIVCAVAINPRLQWPPDTWTSQTVWRNSLYLDDDHSVLIQWNPKEKHADFQLSVRTRGYVSLGLSKDGRMAGSDIMVAWVKNGRPFIQDRHAKGNMEPDIDHQQDWILCSGEENSTHTVISFSRAYDTCDSDDLVISSDTVWLTYAYGDDDPDSEYKTLLYHKGKRGSKTAYILQRNPPPDSLPPGVYKWDLTNARVKIPEKDDTTLYWCQIFKLTDVSDKQHMIGYEPILHSETASHVHHIIVYECVRGKDRETLEKLSKKSGSRCSDTQMSYLLLACNTVIVAWAVGSKGFSFPEDIGYPLDPKHGPEFFMMQTHYDNGERAPHLLDSSGIRIFHTPHTRARDAGVLATGIDPKWKHIIPPSQPSVLSEGHCIAQCTQEALPVGGVDAFAVLLHTHLIGKEVRLRHLRRGEELPPIVEDNNYTHNYQEYRQLQSPRNILPGDHLVTGCVYDSSNRSSLTLGGFRSTEEMCLAYIYYAPRIPLALCQSTPSLRTVLLSLGIDELWSESNPVRIKYPTNIQNLTLENRLLTYNWNLYFEHFQTVTHNGTFRPLCWQAGESVIPGTEDMESMYPRILKTYKAEDSCYSEGIPVHNAANERKGWHASAPTQAPPPRRPPTPVMHPVNSSSASSCVASVLLTFSSYIWFIIGMG